MACKCSRENFLLDTRKHLLFYLILKFEIFPICHVFFLFYLTLPSTPVASTVLTLENHFHTTSHEDLEIFSFDFFSFEVVKKVKNII
jgi:hypothetical protein